MNDKELKKFFEKSFVKKRSYISSATLKATGEPLIQINIDNGYNPNYDSNEYEQWLYRYYPKSNTLVFSDTNSNIFARETDDDSAEPPYNKTLLTNTHPAEVVKFIKKQTKKFEIYSLPW